MTYDYEKDKLIELNIQFVFIIQNKLFVYATYKPYFNVLFTSMFRSGRLKVLKIKKSKLISQFVDNKSRLKNCELKNFVTNQENIEGPGSLSPEARDGFRRPCQHL